MTTVVPAANSFKTTIDANGDLVSRVAALYSQPAADVVFQDDGMGHQISQISGNGVVWDMSPAAFWSLTVVNTSGVLQPVWTPATFGAPAIVTTATGWTLTYTMAGTGSQVVLRVEKESTWGGVFVWFDSVTLNGTDATNFRVNRGQIGVMAVNPPDRPNKTSMNIALPSSQGIVIDEAVNIAVNTRNLTHGGFGNGDQTWPYVFGSDPDPGAAYEPLSLNYSYLYQPEADAGLLVRYQDVDGYWKRLELAGNGDQLVMSTLVLPPSNDRVTTWSMPWKVHIIPVRGGHWWEGSDLYRQIVEAEAMPFISTGKQAASSLPAAWERVDVSSLHIMQGIDEVNEPLSNGREMDRLRAYADSLGFTGMNFGTFGQGQWTANSPTPIWPDYLPIPPDNVTFLQDIRNDGVVTYNYIYLIWGELSAWYTGGWSGTGATNPNTLRCLEQDQTPVELTVDSNNYFLGDWGTADARNHAINQFDFAASRLLGKSFYLDTESVPSHHTYENALADAERGFGSLRALNGVRQLYADMELAYQVYDSEFFLTSEFLFERNIDRIVMKDVGWQLFIDETSATDKRKIPITHAAVNEWNKPVNYTTSVAPLDPGWVPGDPSAQSWLVEPLIFAAEQAAHWGSPVCLGISNFDSVRRIVPANDGSDPINWLQGLWPAQKIGVDFALQLAFVRKQFKDYFRGRRLRSVMGSKDDDIEANGLQLEFTVASNPFGFTFDVMDRDIPFGSVWTTTEQAGNPILIWFSNGSSEDITFNLRMENGKYPMLGMTKLHQTDLFTKARTLLQTFNHGFIRNVTIPARGVALFELTQ